MATVWTSSAAVTHPKKPGSASAVQSSAGHFARAFVTGLKATWGEKGSSHPGREELAYRSPNCRGAVRNRPFVAWKKRKTP